MKTIMGVMKPVAGDVLFKGESIVGKKPFEIVRGGVVLVPEGRQILQNMSVRENLELGAFQRKDKAGISEDLSKVFERFPDFLKDKTSSEAHSPAANSRCSPSAAP